MAITSEVKIKATFDGTAADSGLKKTEDGIKEVANTAEKTSSVLTDMGRVMVGVFSAEKIKMFVKQSVLLAAELDTEATASFNHLSDIVKSFQYEVGEGILASIKPVLPYFEKMLTGLVNTLKKAGALTGAGIDSLATIFDPSLNETEREAKFNNIWDDYKDIAIEITEETATRQNEIEKKRLDEEAKIRKAARDKELAEQKKQQAEFDKLRLEGFTEIQDKLAGIEKERIIAIAKFQASADRARAMFGGSGDTTLTSAYAAQASRGSESNAIMINGYGQINPSDINNNLTPQALIGNIAGNIPEVGGFIKAIWDSLVTISADPNFWENFSKNSGILVENIIANLIPALIRGMPMLVPSIIKGFMIGEAELFQQLFDTETWTRAGQNFLQPFRDFWKEFDDMWNRGELAEVMLDLANAIKKLTNGFKNMGGGLGDISDNSVVGQIGNVLGLRSASPTVVINGPVTGDVTPAFARSIAKITVKGQARQQYARLNYQRL
jgi:hypothetical protein